MCSWLLFVIFFFFFFFKQKTAYEMRISDWSSDVCSSDLEGEARVGGVTACEAVGESGNTECAGVRSHVDAVGQERHRTGPQARDDLDDHHGGREGHHPPRAICMGVVLIT